MLILPASTITRRQEHHEGKIMKIAKGTIVTMEYRVETDKGELIESSVGKGAPIQFNFGKGKMLPGIEKRIEGMEGGHEQEFDIPPEEAFGAKDSGPVREMEKSEFPKDTVFRAGERFAARLPDDVGNVIFEIVENKATSVIVRFHHPHEGKTLRCKVKIISVKAAPPAPPPSKKKKDAKAEGGN
jgi:FKBP-type peptidyl-prolyl cis-trans isomerase 2